MRLKNSAGKSLDVGVYDELFTPEEVKELGLKWREAREADVVFDCFELRFDK